MEIITSRDNPHIKQYLRLSGGKKYREAEGAFVLEGLRLCLDAGNEGAIFLSVFVTESAAERGGAEALLEAAGDHAYCISDRLGEQISDTKATQGVFAICKRLDKCDFASTICSKGRYLVLFELQDPGNLGTILRTADAIGIDGVFVCDCCELYSPKTIRATMGALFRLPIFEDKLSLVLSLLKERKIPTFAAVVDSGARLLTDCNFSEGGAVLIGNEGNGLPAEAVALCEEKLTIKMSGNSNSLNAAMAAGIIIWKMMT